MPNAFPSSLVTTTWPGTWGNFSRIKSKTSNSRLTWERYGRKRVEHARIYEISRIPPELSFCTNFSSSLFPGVPGHRRTSHAFGRAESGLRYFAEAGLRGQRSWDGRHVLTCMYFRITLALVCLRALFSPEPRRSTGHAGTDWRHSAARGQVPSSAHPRHLGQR